MRRGWGASRGQSWGGAKQRKKRARHPGMRTRQQNSKEEDPRPPPRLQEHIALGEQARGESEKKRSAALARASVGASAPLQKVPSSLLHTSAAGRAWAKEEKREQPTRMVVSTRGSGFDVQHPLTTHFFAVHLTPLHAVRGALFPFARRRHRRLNFVFSP